MFANYRWRTLYISWKLVTLAKFLKSRDFESSFQINLTCIFLSLRANSKKSVCLDWPCICQTVPKFWFICLFYSSSKKHSTYESHEAGDPSFSILGSRLCLFIFLIWTGAIWDNRETCESLYQRLCSTNQEKYSKFLEFISNFVTGSIKNYNMGCS